MPQLCKECRTWIFFEPTQGAAGRLAGFAIYGGGCLFYSLSSGRLRVRCRIIYRFGISAMDDVWSSHVVFLGPSLSV